VKQNQRISNRRAFAAAARRTLRAILSAALLFALCTLSTPALAQDKGDYEAERQRAVDLVQQSNFVGALPILEKLAAANDKDTEVLQLLAVSLFAKAATESDAAARKQGFLRARQLALRVKGMGEDNQIVQMLLKIPENGEPEDLKPGKRTPAEEALMEGEAAFARAEHRRAIEAYERALKLDPKLYEAPLFIGDAYYKMGQIEKAGEGYARAIAIDPDRETAYRYWGNVLMQSGKMEESRAKLIEAVIAEPYARNPWSFLAEWGRRSQVELGHPRVDVPKDSVKRKDEKNIDIIVNPTGREDGTEAWMMYSISRAAWMTDERRKKEFPNETRYRHSLREEAGALRAVAEMVERQIKEGKLKEPSLDVSIANLLRLNRAGLLEAYVLLATPDEGIAQDYAEYRKTNRDKLRRYLTEVVMNSGQVK
jgi:tetratricopeptide (TPR) repeat protein